MDYTTIKPNSTRATSDLPSLAGVDTFNHLPACPNRVLPPMRIVMSQDQDVRWSHELASDNEVISWFFSMLIFACTSFGALFERTDFVQNSAEGTKCLVTANLIRYRDQWATNSNNIPADKIFDACLGLHKFCHNHNVDQSLVSDAARMLFALTAEFLESSWRDMIDIVVEKTRNDPKNVVISDTGPHELRYTHNWTRLVSDILIQRFTNSGNCTFTYTRMASLLALDSIFYMSQLRSFESPELHEECSLIECKGHQIDPRTHVVAHARPGCDCTTVQADLDTITKILSQEHLIPVIVFDEGRDLKIRFVPHTEVKHYVAISYAASQLFASPLSNSMPSCQLQTLRHVVSRLSKTLLQKDEVLGMWIDTLLVPMSYINTTLREQALTRMYKTFEQARIVLVVDPKLGSQATTGFVPEEFAAYLLSSPWCSRLWTFSESQIASGLWVWYAGCLIDVDKFLQDQGWPPEDGILRNRLDALSIIGQLRLYSRSVRLNLKVPTKSHTYFDITLRHIRNRMTSQAKDEPFCLSMLMELDSTRVLGAPEEDRMQAFYAQLQNVSGVLLIQSGERLTAPGFRWAPRSLLGQKVVNRYSHVGDHTIREDRIGIRVPAAYYAYKLSVVPSIANVTNTEESCSVKRIFFRVEEQDLLNRTTYTRNPNTSLRLLSFELPADPNMPFSNQLSSFRPPGPEFVLLFRGFTDQDIDTPCAVLELETDPSLEQYAKDNDMKSPTFTSYLKYARYSVHSKDRSKRLDEEYRLEAAFSGDQPWTEHRLVCHAERINTFDCDVWIS